MAFQNICAIERKISEIDAQSDVKVRVLGTIVSKAENSFILDDGSGVVQVITNPKLENNLSESNRVRVLGKISPNGEKFDIIAEIIQDMSGLNTKVYEHVQKLWKSYGEKNG